MRKKIAATILSAVMAVSVMACGSAAAGGEAGSSAVSNAAASESSSEAATDNTDEGASSGATVGGTDKESSSAVTPGSTEEASSAVKTGKTGAGDGAAGSAWEADANPVRKTGTIEAVDSESGDITFLSHEILTNEDGTTEETEDTYILHTADGVPVIDASTGLPLALEELKKGDAVTLWISQATTMSLPPQSALQALVANVPEDAAAPFYVSVKKVEQTETGITVTDQDGNQFQIAADTEITPYLTRQAVRLDDVQEGRFCLIYPGDIVLDSEPPIYPNVEKVILFNF